MKEQELVDICFSIALMVKTEECFKKMSRDDLVEWVRDQLDKCGFPTEPCGSSHGVLI